MHENDLTLSHTTLEARNGVSVGTSHGTGYKQAQQPILEKLLSTFSDLQIAKQLIKILAS